jgi:PfaD family protein
MLSHILAPVAAVATAYQSVIGWWTDDGGGQIETGDGALRRALHDLRRPLWVLETPDGYAVARGGQVRGDRAPEGAPARAVVGCVPALPPARLGDVGFLADLGVRLPYAAGSMANGIASVELVEAMADAGMLGFYGAAGLDLRTIEDAIDRLRRRLDGRPHGFNLIHSPIEPEHERRVVDLYLRRRVRLVEASAYLDLTPAAVRYRVRGIHTTPEGRIVVPNRIVAKASRVEVARRWFSPPPPKVVAALVAAGELTATEGDLARHVPMAQDLTAEADSGGHTDNQPAITLLPTLLALRDRLQEQHGYAVPLRVGAAGGIATPFAASAAFAMGAAYVVTGSVNQGCVESGTSDAVRTLLAQTEQADVTMAPAADMFELGVKLQVLKRGTLFAMRATKLYELYRAHDGLESIPRSERDKLEATLFRAPLEQVWAETERFFAARDPGLLERATRSPKQRMGLVFRWYLGKSSEWANRGETSRQVDYQVWCGPAMGAFNEWTKGSFLEQPERRRAADVARNLLYGAAVVTRLQALRGQGVVLGAEIARVQPAEPRELEEYFR